MLRFAKWRQYSWLLSQEVLRDVHTKWRSKSRKYKTSAVENEQWSPPASTPTWTADGRTAPLRSHSLPFEQVSPKFKPTGVFLQWGWYMCALIRETTTTRQGKWQKKETWLLCAFAGPFLSAWVYPGIPVGPSPPAIIEASVWDCQRDRHRKWLRFPAWYLLSPSVCWGLFHSFLSTLAVLENSKKKKNLKYLHSVLVNTAFSVIIPAVKIIFSCAFWAGREG